MFLRETGRNSKNQTRYDGDDNPPGRRQVTSQRTDGALVALQSQRLVIIPASLREGKREAREQCQPQSLKLRLREEGVLCLEHVNVKLGTKELPVAVERLDCVQG